MSGPTDNGGNVFSAIINGVEHVASDIEQLAEKAVNELANLGISLFNGMNWFIHFLMELQEDPVHVIARMAARIQEIGASISAVLEEIVDGIRAHGLTGYLRIKVQDSLFPYHKTMDQQVTRSGQLTNVHQETLNTMKKKLDTLTTNGTVPGWQGASVDEMSAAFAFHSTTLNNLNTPFSNQNSLTNQYQQNLAIDNFMALLIGFALLDILLIVCGLVGSVFTFGGAAVLGTDILVGVIALEVLILLAYAQTATHSWQNGTSSLYQTQSSRKPDDPVSPTPTPKAFPPIPPLRNSGNDLTPAQKRLKEDVKIRLGLTSYDESQLDALIRAGYLDPDAIAAIIMGGSFSIFMDPPVKDIATTLTKDQQKRFVAIVENYRKTHPGLTSHEVYNYLRGTKMKYQLQSFLDDLDGKTGDPISKALLNDPNLKPSIQGMRSDLYRKAGKILNPSIDLFTVSDLELSGWYSSMTGTWGEWSTLKQYSQQPGTHIVAISTLLINPMTGMRDSEVDLKIEENGVEKWVEIKNAQTTGQWSKSITQAGTYFKHGAKHIIIEWPQQGVNGIPAPGTQQWAFFEREKAKMLQQYPGSTIEVRTGKDYPNLHISFDPPSSNWGASIP